MTHPQGYVLYTLVRQEQAYILTYFLPADLSPLIDPVQLGQPNLIRKVKVCGLLSDVDNSLHRLTLVVSVLGQRVYRLETILFHSFLGHSN